MKCAEIIRMLNELAPEQIACSWDNVGLLAGRNDKDVQKILLCLDVTDAVVEQAVTQGVDMIVSHHPLLFRPLKRINNESMTGRRLLQLIQGDVVCYAMHTSFDCAEKGMAYAAANLLQLQDQQVLDEAFSYEDAEGVSAQGGIGRIGELSEPVTVRALLDTVKDTFQTGALLVYGADLEKQVSRVAISPGSGKDQVEAALRAQAQVLLTGDISHHIGLDAKEQGLILVDAGHYNLEHIFSEYVAAYLKERLAENVEISVFSESRPYIIYE